MLLLPVWFSAMFCFLVIAFFEAVLVVADPEYPAEPGTELFGTVPAVCAKPVAVVNARAAIAAPTLMKCFKQDTSGSLIPRTSESETCQAPAYGA